MIAAIIPTRYHPPFLEPLLKVLEADAIPVQVFESEEWGHELHKMWNAGRAWARDIGATDLAILNDDIKIQNGAIAAIADALRAPDYPNAAVAWPDRRATFGKALPNNPHPRMAPAIEEFGLGHCFVIKTELDLPPFDERYHIHHGDLLFFEQVRAMGYVCVRAKGVPCWHYKGFSVGRAAASDPTPLVEDRLLARDEHPSYPLIDTRKPHTPGFHATWQQAIAEERKARSRGTLKVVDSTHEAE